VVQPAAPPIPGPDHHTGQTAFALGHQEQIRVARQFLGQFLGTVRRTDGDAGAGALPERQDPVTIVHGELPQSEALARGTRDGVAREEATRHTAHSSAPTTSRHLPSIPSSDTP